MGVHKMEVVEEESANEETANAEHISATAGAYFITEFHRDHMAALHSATPLSSRLPRKWAGSTRETRVDMYSRGCISTNGAKTTV